MALLFFLLSPSHGFGGRYDNLVPAFRTNIGFATSATETVAARTVEQVFIPCFSAQGAGYEGVYFFHARVLFAGRS